MTTLIMPQKSSSLLWVKKLGTVAERMNFWFERRRQRQQLARLDNRMKRDIGLSDQQIENEIRKPFWR